MMIGTTQRGKLEPEPSAPVAAPRGEGPAPAGEPVGVALRKWPYPYAAMLAICSDLDETPDAETYLSIARYLNTRDRGAAGQNSCNVHGVGLEVGNSIYFDMPRGQFSYWNTDDRGRAMIRRLVHSGHIDCLHSYGDLAHTRAQAARALEELNAHGCRLEVWVDHSKAPTNFGPDIMRGSGDVAGAAAYHADLTLDYGIRYVWRGRTTGVIGQDAPAGGEALCGLFDAEHPVASLRTLAKEAVKVFLGAQGHPRWRLYAENFLCASGVLRDGGRVWEFLRSNPYWGGSGRGDTAEGIGGVLTDRVLDLLAARAGACVLYTHLGKRNGRHAPFDPPAQAAFERLAARQERGEVLVTTTRRLLRYVTARDGLCCAAERIGEWLRIRIDAIEDAVFGRRPPTAEELSGMTFSVRDARDIRQAEIVMPGGESVSCDIIRREAESMIVIPWKRLTFPEVD